MFGKDPFIRMNKTCHLFIRDHFYKMIHSNKSNFPILLRRAECLMNHFTRMNQTLHSCIFETMFMKRFAQMNNIFQCYSTCERALFEMCQFNRMNQTFHFCKWEKMFMEAVHSNESNSQVFHLTPYPNYTRHDKIPAISKLSQSNITANQKRVWAGMALHSQRNG